MNITDLRDLLSGVGEGLDARLAESMLATSPNLVYIYDLSELRYAFISGETASVFGYTSKELQEMGESVIARLVHPEDANRLKEHHNQMAGASEGDVFEIEYRIKHAYGDWHWLSARDTPLVHPKDAPVRYILGTIEDITERRAAQEKVWYVSTHDQLTGLFNRIYFQAEINRMEKSRRYPVSILYVDVIGLKLVNDEQGHEAGDDLLRRTGQVLLSAFRAEDVVARIGGDEFGVILPNTGSVSTDAIVSRVKTHLNSHNQSHHNAPLALAMGIATVEYGESLREAEKSAEKRLNDAKIAASEQ